MLWSYIVYKKDPELAQHSVARYFVNVYTKKSQWQPPKLIRGWTQRIADSGRP